MQWKLKSPWLAIRWNVDPSFTLLGGKSKFQSREGIEVINKLRGSKQLVRLEDCYWLIRKWKHSFTLVPTYFRKGWGLSQCAVAYYITCLFLNIFYYLNRSSILYIREYWSVTDSVLSLFLSLFVRNLGLKIDVTDSQCSHYFFPSLHVILQCSYYFWD